MNINHIWSDHILQQSHKWLPNTSEDISLTTPLELFKQDQINLTYLFSIASSAELVMLIIYIAIQCVVYGKDHTLLITLSQAK